MMLLSIRFQDRLGTTKKMLLHLLAGAWITSRPIGGCRPIYCAFKVVVVVVFVVVIVWFLSLLFFWRNGSSADD